MRSVGTVWHIVSRPSLVWSASTTTCWPACDQRLVGRRGEHVGRGQAAFDGDAVAGEEDLGAAQALQAPAR